MTGVVQSALGNLPELFFGIFALRAGLVGVVQAALIGSILANVLLVLGLAFIVGGLKNGTQRFSAESARAIVVLLVLAVSVLMIPTLGVHLDPAVARGADGDASQQVEVGTPRVRDHPGPRTASTSGTTIVRAVSAGKPCVPRLGPPIMKARPSTRSTLARIEPMRAA